MRLFLDDTPSLRVLLSRASCAYLQPPDVAAIFHTHTHMVAELAADNVCGIYWCGAYTFAVSGSGGSTDSADGFNIL